MRVAFLVDKTAPFFIGGYENRILDLARLLAARHDVCVFSSMDAASARIDHVDYRRVCSTTFQRDVSGQRRLAHGALFASALLHEPAVLRAWDPSVVIVQAIPYAHLPATARWLSRGRTPWLLDVCEAWTSYKYAGRFAGSAATRAVHGLLADAARRADHIMAISEATRTSLETAYQVPIGNVSVVPLCAPPPAGPASGGTGPPLDFLFLNRLVPEKRPLDFVEALRRLRVDHGWTGAAAIAGGGPLLAKVSEAVAAAGLDAQVTVTGFVSPATKESLLTRARTFVLPSEREGFSLAALEALSHGVPVVAAQPPLAEVFGVGDLVEPERNGLLFPLGDIPALVAALIRRLSVGPSEGGWDANARATASRYSPERVRDRLEEALRRTVAATAQAE